MKKVRFPGLIIMMLLSVIGIIIVQIVWISNAIGIRNEIFNNAIVVSLNNAANAIETSRKMDFFNNFILSDQFNVGDTSRDIQRYLNDGKGFSDSGNIISGNIVNQTITGNLNTGEITTVNKSYSFNGDTSIITGDSTTFIVAPSDRSGKMEIIKKGEAGSGSLYVGQDEFLEWVKKRSSEFQNMSDQMISDIYQWERTINLDRNEINKAINQSLSYAGIQTPFEFALIRNGSLEDGIFGKSDKEDFLTSNYKVRLFPINLIRQDLVLSVIFPERTNYVIGSMVWILAGSLLFSLFIVATFGLSLYFIFRQKKISEMKSDFINNMTHEFKTPIATISLAADTITNPKVIKDETSIRHFIAMIKKENSRMNKKVENILQIASLEKREIDFNFENVSVHTIIQHVLETIDLQVQQRKGKIRLCLDAEESEILGDNEHLSHLVNNLLDNAIKYSPEAPEITISTRNEEKGLILTVEDKGIGMTKTVQGKIFERFYRQNSGNVHDVKGFGLGLNYARAIIDSHKGSISVFSEPGKGSRFEVFLPFNWEN
jgi:two-component system phosphate regulon sensor histidine kinase PhoR